MIVKKSSPKNLSVDCRSTVGRHITDSLPTEQLEEREKEAEELANLVRTRDEVVKNLERRLVNAKKLIAELRAEMQELQRRGQPAPQEDQPTQQPQQTDSRVASRLS